MIYIICYDIADDKRREKVSITLETYGRRVQESVFECDFERTEMSKLVEKVKKIIKCEDSLLVFNVCKECYSKSFGFGKKPFDKFENGYIIF